MSSAKGRPNKSRSDDQGAAPRPLERYLQILEAVTGRPDGLSAGELQNILGLPKTTVNRLLHGLAASALVHSSGGRSASFRLGDRLIRVLQSDSAWIEAMSRRILKELADATGETCFIARLISDHVTSIAMESPDASVGIYVMPGHQLPPYATASGKLLIALQDNETIERHLSMPRVAITAHTIVSRRALAAEFKRIREKDFAIEQGEHVEGLATIACPLRVNGNDRVCFALGVTGSGERVVRAQARLLPVLRKAAGSLGPILTTKGSG